MAAAGKSSGNSCGECERGGVRSVLAALAGGGDAELGAVFGDGAAFDFDALLFEAGDDFVVAEGAGLVFLVDDLLHLGFDAVPPEGFAGSGFGAAGEEAAEGIDSAWGLHPFVVDGA